MFGCYVLCGLWRSDWESKVTICSAITILSFVTILDVECIVWMPVCKYAHICSYWVMIVDCKALCIVALI